MTRPHSSPIGGQGARLVTIGLTKSRVPAFVVVTQVAELAGRLWAEGGTQWLEENRMTDQQLKDELDFLEDDTKDAANVIHYPPGLQRPNLGT